MLYHRPRPMKKNCRTLPHTGGGGGISWHLNFAFQIDREISHAKFRVLREFLAHQQYTLRTLAGGQTLTPGGSVQFPTVKFTTANLTWHEITPPPPPKTRSGPQRVRTSSGERPIGAAKGKRSDTEALCKPSPPPPLCVPGRACVEHFVTCVRPPSLTAVLRPGCEEGGGGMGTPAHTPPISGGIAASSRPGTTCSDGLKNGDEVGIDCGGSCSLCGMLPVAATRLHQSLPGWLASA